MDLTAIKRFMRGGWATAAMDRPTRPSMVFENGNQRMTISKSAREMWGRYSRIAGIPSIAKQNTDSDFTATWSSYADEFFGKDGALSKMIDGYAPRAAQISMSRIVQRTIEMRDIAVVNAPTGTGKSLAYIVPAMKAKADGIDGSIIISTSNKALQRQIMRDDAPMMKGVFPNIKVAALKGKTNYICEIRLRNADLHPRTRDMLECLPTGEIDEIELTIEERQAVQLTPDTSCAGCELRPTCRFQEQRAEAKKADIVIINHASLAMSMVNPMASNYPAPGVIIVDEAHKFEPFIRSAMGKRITARGMELLAAAIERVGAPAPEMFNAWNGMIEMVRDGNDGILPDEYCQAALDLCKKLGDIANRIEPDDFPPQNDEERERLAVSKRVRRFQESLAGLARASVVGECRWVEKNEFGAVTAFEMTEVDISEFCNGMLGYVGGEPKCDNCGGELGEYEYLVHFRPTCVECLISMDPDDEDIICLEDTEVESVDRFPLAPAWIFTSATLETATPSPFTGQTRKASLDTFCKRMGIPKVGDAYSALLASTPSPFDYAKNTMLYVPPEMPAPVFGKNDHTYAAIGHMRQAVDASEGGALILFASNFAMRQCYDALKKPFKKSGYNVMCQGELPNSTIVETMRTDIGSVTFATKSFFEGVDVPTLALRLVIAHKIPFEPSTPLNVAREAAAHAEGEAMGLTGDALKFYSFQQIRVVDASLEMQQLFGRLVRRVGDQGVWMVTDPRLMTTRYGREQIGKVLPVRATGETEIVMAFLKRLAVKAREEIGHTSGKQFKLGLDI